MWKVFLAYVCHRALLFFMALATINATLAPSSTKRIQPTPVLLSQFVDKVGQTTEARVVEALSQKPISSLFSETRNPFYWIAVLVKNVTGLSSAIVILILSNLFCLLFLWELYALTSRMSLPEVAVGTAALAMLWITSYELSLGSYQSLTCFLVALAVRHALDNTWLLGGIALGLLAITDLLAVGLIPLLLILFWYYQRHEQMGDVVKRGLFFFLPLAIALALRFNDLSYLSTQYQSSALGTIVKQLTTGQWSWFFTQANLGQSISVIVFLIGTIVTILVNTIWLHRLIPGYLFFAVLLFSDFSTLGSRMIIAAIVLEGISAVSSNIVERLIQLALIVIACFEVSSIF